MQKRLIVVTAILLVVTAGFAIAFVIVVEPFRPAPDGPATVRNRVQEIHQLVTTRYQYRDVVYFDEQTRLLGIPAGSQQVLFAVDIIVTVGIDLSKGLEVRTGNRRSREVFLTVPEPSVLRVEAIESTIDQYFARHGLRRLDWREIADEVERAKERNGRDAVERGAVARSRSHGEFVLRSILTAAGYDQIHIRFRPAQSGEIRG